jgi:hypothetical protein
MRPSPKLAVDGRGWPRRCQHLRDQGRHTGGAGRRRGQLRRRVNVRDCNIPPAGRRGATLHGQVAASRGVREPVGVGRVRRRQPRAELVPAAGAYPRELL